MPYYLRVSGWCGPLWCQMNYMIARGLHEQGEAQLAEKCDRIYAKLLSIRVFEFLTHLLERDVLATIFLGQRHYG